MKRLHNQKISKDIEKLEVKISQKRRVIRRDHLRINKLKKPINQNDNLSINIIPQSLYQINQTLLNKLLTTSKSTKMYNEPNQQMEQNQIGDPFSQRSGTIVYQKHISTNILISDKPGVVEKLPSQQELLIKLCVEGTSDSVRLISLQLTSDSELQFNFQFRCNDMQFRRIKQIQKFFINFRDYPEAIIKNFQKLGTKNNNQKFQCNFTIFSETQGKLDITRKSQIKDDLIMEFNFSRSTEQHIRSSVQYRYDRMRRQYAQRVKRFQQYRQIIRSKNPSLIIQIDKALKTKK